jgi:RNA polymerase sigma-70 factor, ECF subfamily
MLASADITELLADWTNGDRQALDKLYPFVEKELHRMAHHYMKKLRPGNTLQTTAVINETYLRMIKHDEIRWQNRAHFFGLAANMMRQFIVNYIREHKAQKRGGEFVPVELDEAFIVTDEKSEAILALEDALERLNKLDERKAKVVVMRFYGGLSVSETAEVLKVSEVTVMRDWNLAKAWLAREIRNED